MKEIVFWLALIWFAITAPGLWYLDIRYGVQVLNMDNAFIGVSLMFIFHIIVIMYFIFAHIILNKLLWRF